MDLTASTGLSIFATMSQMCREYQAINLSQGCPDFDTDPLLIDLAYQYMKQGFNQYSPMEGILSLREEISRKVFKSYLISVDPLSEITITAGATEAVFVALKSLVQPGDEVILFEPAFDSYVPTVRMSGGVPVPIALNYPEYTINWEEVKDKITSKTKAILLNTPHNPTGTVLTLEDIKALEQIITTHPITIISDEVYEHIIFDGNNHESILSSEILRKNALVIFSFGKTFHATGWRMGYCIAPRKLMLAFRKIHQYVTFSAVTSLQYAIADYLQDEGKYLSLPLFFQNKRDYFLDLMKGSRFDFLPSKGTYFQLMSYREISDEKDIEFSSRLVKELKVASIPLSPFFSTYYNDRIIRFCFAKKEETLAAAAEQLWKI